MNKLHYQTVPTYLLKVLRTLMSQKSSILFVWLEGPHLVSTEATDSLLIWIYSLTMNTADEDFDPVCLRSKHWEIIKLDMIDFAIG